MMEYAKFDIRLPKVAGVTLTSRSSVTICSKLSSIRYGLAHMTNGPRSHYAFCC